MSRFVVDASVAIKWFLPEVHDMHARRLLTGGHALLVPDLLFPEVGNILRKRVQRNDITATEADTILQTLGSLPLEVSPSWPLVTVALTIACHAGRTVYDSLYLALAIREKTQMVTADEKLYNALQTSPLVSVILWVEKIP
ncbi:MAG: type II toxin-antitoxin system VapC family toxin [Capsulimonadales bacterium]|nr:type II toxin-antitoxin system VapC family toxin [Capsulimonadales bacterium]